MPPVASFPYTPYPNTLFRILLVLTLAGRNLTASIACIRGFIGDELGNVSRMKKPDGVRGPQKLDQNEPASTAEALATELIPAPPSSPTEVLGYKQLSP
jgi:hypothetical protein